MAGPSDAPGAQAASDARGVMLARIRAALGPDPAPVTVPRTTRPINDRSRFNY